MNKKTRNEMNTEVNDQEGGHSSDDFQGTWILTQSQEFLRRTFSFLPAKILLGVCSRVCKAWHAEAKWIVHRREEIGWATFGRINVEQNPRSAKDPPNSFRVGLKSCLNNIGSLPRIAIVFTECMDRHDSRKLIHAKLTKMEKGLPSDCMLAFLNVDGTIGLQPDLTPAGESMGDVGTSCVLLPNMDGVTINCKKYLPLTDMKSTINLPADTKCILVFTNAMGATPFVNHFQLDLYEKNGTVPVIAGGMARNLMLIPKVSKRDKRTSSSTKIMKCLTVALSGPNVSAASVVLDYGISDREKVRQKMLELKKAGLSEKRSLAFMFSCVGRGSDFYGEEDVESSIFHEIFPQTPLLGFFAGGEFGCDRLTNEKLSQLPKLGNSYSCVLCLLSFGKQK